MATSRTAEGKHTKRFIILKKDEFDNKFVRSATFPKYYGTREEAQLVVDSSINSSVQYKVRQK